MGPKANFVFLTDPPSFYYTIPEESIIFDRRMTPNHKT